MEKLSEQLIQFFENNGETERSAASGKALREIVFSGMSRCGFFRECPYLPAFDHQVNKTFYVCFLHAGKSDEFSLEMFLPYIGDELNALGISAVPVNTKYGFSVEFIPDETVGSVRLDVFIYHKVIKEPKIQLSYNQTPLAYELRTVTELASSLTAEIQNALEKNIKDENAAEKKKKGPKKARAEKKQAEKAEDKWVQPSLFDF